MEITFIEHNNEQLAILADENHLLHNAQEAAELLMNCYYAGTNKIIIAQSNLLPDFFELKTGMAGDILQKFSTYDGYLAIVGDFSEIAGKSLRDFIRESNKQGRINFVPDREAAVKALLK